MCWRKCLVRSLVFSTLAALLLGAGVYVLWTNPTAVRQVVEEQLGGRFVRVSVHLGSARLRLLGGILVQELRMARTDGLDSSDFLYVPSAVIYHDKEHMLQGKVLVRKVELTGAMLRLIRDRDGRWNLAGILGPTDLNERLPTLVLRNGTVVFDDRGLSPGAPLLEMHNVNLTVVNDPLPTLQIVCSGETDVLGPIRISASVSRETLASGVQLDLPAVAIGQELLRRAVAVCPKMACLNQLSGLAEVHAKLQSYDEATGKPPFSYDVSARLKQGRCQHPLLPDVLEEIDFAGHCADGMVSEAELSARSGPARLHARVADFRIPEKKEDLQDVHGLMRELDVSVEHLEATKEVLERLPDCLRFIETDYSPAGPISVSYTYRQPGALAGRGNPAPEVTKEWLVHPEGMDGSFIDFPYPLKQIRGSIRVDTAQLPLLNVALDLSCQAGGQPVTLRGSVKGEKKTSEVHLDIRGTNIVLDDKILHGLSPDRNRVSRAAQVAQQFLPEQSRLRGLATCPMGKADFQALVWRPRGQERLNQRYTISFKDAAVQFDEFPYPLENVSGTLIVLPDHWECKDFHGSHAGGEVFCDGGSEAMPDRAPVLRADGSEGSRPEITRLFIRGRQVLLDCEFAQALSPRTGNKRPALQETWRTLMLSGRMNFSAEVIDHPNHPQDIDVNVHVEGCSFKPAFFDYVLSDASASVHYTQGRVYLRDIHAQHGQASLALPTGLIEMKPGGGFLAWLHGIRGQNVTPDRELLLALPEGLRKVLEPLQLHEPLTMAAALTIDAPAGPGAPFKVWWDGGVNLTDASLRTGVEVKGANGEFHCRGHHDGKRVRGVFGDLLLNKLVVLGQPVSNLHARLEVQQDTPDVVRIRDLKASLFGGTVGGEARLETASGLHYDVLLEALGIQLDQFGKKNLGEIADRAQLQGPARASLHLEGDGTDLLGLKGNGRVDMEQCRIGRLPVLLDLLKLFGLRAPDRTAFEQAHVDFAIEGPQLRVQQLDLLGNAISLRGQGTVDLNGDNVELDFTATPGRVTEVLPTGIDSIPRLISQQFFKIKMRGKMGKEGTVRFDKELLPPVVEPLRRILGDW
jgi:hypothetical protein